MEKCGDWVQYDTVCGEYICPNCYDKRDISADNNFFVAFALEHGYYGQVSIQLSTRALNYIINCIELNYVLNYAYTLLIFLSAYLLEIDQVQFKNSNYDVLLSA